LKGEIFQNLAKIVKKLELSGLTNSEARTEARIIVAHVLRVGPLDVYFHSKPLTPEEKKEIEKLLKRRCQGEPLAYVLGEAEFWGRRFVVGQGVLIPRPETEQLVEVALSLISPGPQWVCELGVGSGVVSLTLALERKDLKVFGIEKSPKALQIALTNRKQWRLEKRVFFARGDWFSPLRPGPYFSLVVSNPPYIAPEEWTELPPEIRDYEPKEALWAPKKGLYYIEKTLREAPTYLKPNGFVCLEIGYRQGPLVREIASRMGYKTEIIKDFAGHQRILVAKLKDTLAHR